MIQPSIELTQKLNDQLLLEPAQRTPEWKQAFYETVFDAALCLGDPQVVQGPDGFPYFVLNFPEPNVQFQAVSISVVLDHCLDHGMGIVLNPRQGAADWVFTFGNLWTKRTLDTFEVPVPEVKQPDNSQERQILISAPSEDFLPMFARDAIRTFLTERVKLAEPKVMMITDEAAVPGQSLAFSVFREDCRDEQHFGAIMTYIRWFLPGNYGLVSIPKDAPFLDRFLPL